MLTAEELLRNRGIKCIAWNEFEKSKQVLPVTGQKQFEPNDSWLQNMQIEKSLTNCKELINIERVERKSQLAIAEWLPIQKRACVKKHSGQDWRSFGLEKNGILYLIPEEALFLLEANCLELLWNDVPLSIQQAYKLLIDNVECCIEEYRVYSQLVRSGYRIQRYIYEYPDREDSGMKRKLVIEPENGLRMAESQKEPQSGRNANNGRNEKGDTNPHRKVIEESGDKCHDGKLKRPSKIGIIAEETVRTNIKIIIKQNSNNHPGENITATNSKGCRIQRNVKLLPKRFDNSSSTDVLQLGANLENGRLKVGGKRKPSSKLEDSAQRKNSRQEVIKLSDDEIQELPKPLSKMEILNLLPNIASRDFATTTIMEKYIPPNIKPQTFTCRYNSRTLHKHGNNRSLQAEQNVSPTFYQSKPNSMISFDGRQTLPPFYMNFNFANPFTGGLHPFSRVSFVQFPPPYPPNNVCNGRNFRYSPNNPGLRKSADNEVYHSSFKVIPGTSSWSELKRKWREERIITIADEENTDKENCDCSEIEVVESGTKPLVRQNAANLAEVFERLRIIKSAPEKTTRRKRSKYKISYNVYSNSQHYAKSNPEPPLYRVVVKREKDDQFIEPIEFHRLQRDAQNIPIVLACVSMSISYMRPSFVTVPNIT